MKKDGFQLSGNSAEIYEEQKVPAIFGPLPDLTLEVVPLGDGDDVLDIACGTGILARKAREKFTRLGRVVGIDNNEGMISTASGLHDEYSKACKWRVSDAGNIPFEDRSFSAIFCQQGLQFFPDEFAALSEMKRLLKPNGKLALTIWSRPPILFTVMAEALTRHVGKKIGDQSLAPFTYEGRDTLVGKLRGIGFVDVGRNEISMKRVVRDPESSIPKEIASNPIGPVVAAKGKSVMNAIVAEILEGISEYRFGNELVLPQHTHIFQASVE